MPRTLAETARRKARFEHLAQNLPIQHQIRHQPLQPRILVSQLPELVQLAHTEGAVLPFPRVELGFADSQLPAHIRYLRPRVRMRQCECDLLFGESRLHHRFTFSSQRASKRLYSSPKLSGPSRVTTIFQSQYLRSHARHSQFLQANSDKYLRYRPGSQVYPSKSDGKITLQSNFQQLALQFLRVALGSIWGKGTILRCRMSPTRTRPPRGWKGAY